MTPSNSEDGEVCARTRDGSGIARESDSSAGQIDRYSKLADNWGLGFAAGIVIYVILLFVAQHYASGVLTECGGNDADKACLKQRLPGLAAAATFLAGIPLFGAALAALRPNSFCDALAKTLNIVGTLSAVAAAYAAWQILA